MCIYRAKNLVCLYFCFLITLPVGVLNGKQTMDMTICFNKLATPANNTNINLMSFDRLPSQPYIFAHPLTYKKYRMLSLHKRWCNENYYCYSFELPSQSMRKPVMLISALPFNRDLTQRNQNLELKVPYHHNMWKYKYLTSMSIKKINSQRFDVKFSDFTHPYQDLDFSIKVRTQKWSVVDNKHGSALIRIDRSIG